MEQKNVAGTFRIFPNALDFIVMAIWVFVAQILTVRFCGWCGMEFPDTTLVASPDDELSLWAQLSAAQSLAIIYPISMFLATAGVLLYGRLRGTTPKIVAGSLSGFDPSRLLGLFVMMVAVQFVIEPLTALMPPTPPMIGRGFFTILVSVLFAPVFEEILCRGIILESFRSKYGVWSGLIWSSLFFGVIHGHITAMVTATLMGLILGYAYIRSNSIFSPIILHALNNGLALALMAFGLGDSTFRDIIPSTEIYWNIWAVAFVIVVLGFVIMGRKIKKMTTQSPDKKNPQ